MITSIEIDGFKSLRNFRMDFRKGLNVLAGPNGSGKTNILQALEFIVLLFNDSVKYAVEEALNRFGEILAKSNASSIISFKIDGETYYNGPYSFTISIDLETLEINKLEPEILEKKFYFQDLKYNFQTDDGESYHPIVEDIEQIRAFSIEPDVAKQSSNKKHMLDMNFNGKNLSKVVYDIIEPKKLRLIVRFGDKKNLLDYARLLFSTIVDISAFTRNESSDVTIDIIYKEDEQGVSRRKNLSELSSGEISWFALSTILTYLPNRYIAFDEPDRHLHPDMIRTMVSLFRDHAEQGPGWLLLTTHNETLLNQCRVDEVQIVELDEQGHTRVRPVHNAEALPDLIYESGKQIGWYYTHNAL